MPWVSSHNRSLQWDVIIHQFINFKVSHAEPNLKVGMDSQLIVGH